MRFTVRCRVGCCVNTTDGASLVCDTCWDRRNALRRDLPELWLRLHGQLAKSAQGPSEGLSRPRPGSRPPLQVHVLDTLAAVPRALANWADLCLGEDGPMVREHRRDGHLLTEAIHVLDAEDERLRTYALAGMYLGALARLHRRMTVLVGLEPTMTRLNAPCVGCGQSIVALYRDAERRSVTCTLCGRVTPDAVWIGALLDAPWA